MNHTKEPWFLLDSIYTGERIGANDCMGNPVVIAGTSYGPTICGEANAQRIVACVNACAGLENPEALPEIIDYLEAIPRLFDDMFAFFASGPIQRSDGKKYDCALLNEVLNGASKAIAKLKGGM